MTEKTVQVPVSLIEALRFECPPWRRSPAIHVLVGMLSQPTPTAEPTLPVRAVAAVLDEYDNGDGECESEDRWRLFRDMRSLLASEQVASPTAEPPRIEDLAPGTTFLAKTHSGMASCWTTVPIGLVKSAGGSIRLGTDIDPSTIRDVTPPPA